MNEATEAPTPILSKMISKFQPEGTELLSIDEVTVGQTVAIHSRGGWRTAVVTKINKTRIETAYVTPGGVKEAEAHIAMAKAIAATPFGKWVEPHLEQARKHFAYFASDANPSDARRELVAEGLDAYLVKNIQTLSESYGRSLELAEKTGMEAAKVTRKKASEFFAVAQ